MQDDSTMGPDDPGYEPRHGRSGDEGPTPAQAAAARGRYEEMHASTGGDSKTPPPVEPEVAPYPEDEAPRDAGEAAIAEAEQVLADAAAADPAGVADAPSADAQLAAERLLDLQRLQAEYVNYKKRVDRDRSVEADRAKQGVVESLLPVLDEIHLARQHGDLTDGPFAKIAEKLETILGKYGVVRYGEVHEPFDPTIHEAVMHTQAELPAGVTATTVTQILQPGYKIGDRVVRAALVAVADPA